MFLFLSDHILSSESFVFMPWNYAQLMLQQVGYLIKKANFNQQFVIAGLVEFSFSKTLTS